jgi:hypothetical protein
LHFFAAARNTSKSRDSGGCATSTAPRTFRTRPTASVKPVPTLIAIKYTQIAENHRLPSREPSKNHRFSKKMSLNDAFVRRLIERKRIRAGKTKNLKL